MTIHTYVTVQSFGMHLISAWVNRVGANSDTLFSLGKAMQFLGHSRNPQVFQSWVVHELCVFGDCFFCDWMDDAIEDLFNVDVVLKPIC